MTVTRAAALPLWPRIGPHAARLADDRAKRVCAKLRQAGDHVRHAAASGLLVIGKGEVDGPGEAQFRQRRHGRENGGQEIPSCRWRRVRRGRSPSPRKRERIAGPLRLGGGNHVHMAGEDIARRLPSGPIVAKRLDRSPSGPGSSVTTAPWLCR